MKCPSWQHSIDYGLILRRKGQKGDISGSTFCVGISTFGSAQLGSRIHFTAEDMIEKLDSLNYTGAELTPSPLVAFGSWISWVKAILPQYNLIPVIFILSNGPENINIETKARIYDLKNEENPEIFSIGITGDASKESLYHMASEPKKEHVYILENYPAISWLIKKITDEKTDYSQCGLGHENIHSIRIVGGREVTDPWPWMAALYFFVDRSHTVSKLLCGGSIVHESYILTAAHCLYDKKSRLKAPTDIIVKLGLTDVKNETFVQIPEVMQVIPHPGYRSRSAYHAYDIALLRLKDPIRFNTNVRPICLPPLELEQDSVLYDPRKLSVATGWGHEENVFPNTHQATKISEHLKEIILPIQTRQKCMKSLTDHGIFRTIFTDHMFCAGGGHQGNDTCYGDSGGPLMQWQRNSDGGMFWTQIGIVSWGIGCGVPNTYGFYTHVQKLKSWIDEVLD